MLTGPKQRRRHCERLRALQRLDRRARRDPPVISIVSFAAAGAAGRIEVTVAEARGAFSGIFRISSARARLGKRRMNPRSWSAEISR